jgi:hypothetical protein
MKSLSIGASEPRQRLRQRDRYSSQRNSKHRGDFPVAQAFGAQAETILIRFGKRVHRCKQATLSLRERQLTFGIGRRVKLLFRDCAIGSDGIARNLVGVAMLQSKIVRDAKNPTPQIAPRFPQPQMLEQRQENFLCDFLGVMSGYAEGERVTKNWVTKLIEESHNLNLDIRGG